MELTITINGIEHTFNADNDERLLDILRDRLNLTGSKNGCHQGHCGACTIVNMTDKKAIRSCLLRADRIEGKEFLTIEGLSERALEKSNGKKLHPIQEAMVEKTAIQCGFCTPGIVMRLYALFEFNDKVTEEMILNALKRHLCRCTGYKPIKDAALLAKQLMNK